MILVVLAITSARRGLLSPKKKGTGDAGALPSCLKAVSDYSRKFFSGVPPFLPVAGRSISESRARPKPSLKTVDSFPR